MSARAKNPSNPSQCGSHSLCGGGRLVACSQMPKLDSRKSAAQSGWSTPPANLEGQEGANSCRLSGEGSYTPVETPARKYCEIGRIRTVGRR